ncbi:hypothetical protein Tco_1346158 [Tanacetum coccineum]
MNDVHTCPKTQTYPNHRNANKKVIDHLLTPKLQDNKRVLKRKDIQQDILSEYKINISYQQAWRGKDHGLQQIRGSPCESFEMLPYYCYKLERKNQGAVTRIKTDNEGVFEMLFIALGASIRTFLNYLRPLLIIDATHLKSEYKGTNLVAVGMDENNQIVPVAFALAVHNEFPLAFHVVCCRHLMMNLSLKNKSTKWLFWKICKSYTPDEFTTNMNILLAVQPDAYHKLCEAGPQRWSRAHYPLIRYNYMTSNSFESVNAYTVLTRKLPVTKLAETYRAMFQDWYFKRQEVADCVQFVSDWFKKEKYQGTYAESIHFIGDMQEWEFLSHIHPAIPPQMDNPQPGRPKNTNRILSQSEEPREVDGASVTSWRLLFIIPSPNVTKLIGFTRDDQPIVEVDTGQHMLQPLQVYDRTSQEFHNVGIEADGGSFFIGSYKESLILLNV